jgi:SpoVK/Ycf46/Vps4 family AAA+-type ATPase
MGDDNQLAALGARPIVTDTDPDELVLPREAGQRLGWIANWLSQPPFIFREWGLSRYVDGGLRALLRGPSGTGKTMAAIALGKSTGRPLWATDPAPILSGDIGRRLFTAADDAGAILLFDQGDATIGDLLRRIEPFQGLAIIATNAEAGIEEDAVSRIDLIIDFPKPDQAAREALWTNLLASVKLPKAELTPRLLARHELTGAEILRCVRLATSLAATDERPLDMDMLQAAAQGRIAMRP